MELNKVKRRQNLSEEVSEQIVGQILSGALKPGERLPPEPELCEKLGVGRTSLREGLRPLVLLNLIEMRHGDGTFVSDNPSEFFAKPLTWGLMIGKETVSQLIEARELIELGTSAMAAERGTDEDMAKLGAIVAEMESLVDDPAAFLDRDLAFHVQIAAMSGNAVLHRQALSMVGLLRPWIAQVAGLPGDAYDTLRVHRQILEAIQRRDPAGARAAMAEQTRSWRSQLARALAPVEPAPMRE